MLTSTEAHEEPLVSVVVPVFNEADIVPELVQRLVDACSSRDESYEIIFVNDGSLDPTLCLLLEEAATRPELVIVDLSRNFGHMPALAAGVNAALGQGVVVMDGDLQDPPELIPTLVEKWRKGAKVVLAQRTSRGEDWLQKTMTSIFYYMLTRICDIPVKTEVGTFCLLDRQVVEVINKMPERIRIFAGLRAWAGFATEIVGYQREARKRGSSKVGLAGKFRLAVNSLIAFSNRPLLWLSRLSLFTSLCFLAFGLCVIGIRLFSSLAIPGWASIVVLIGTVASLHSAVLAVLSEYIAVIFEETKQRPHFVVSHVYRKGKAERGL